jgi:hypothetical protein
LSSGTSRAERRPKPPLFLTRVIFIGGTSGYYVRGFAKDRLKPAQ